MINTIEKINGTRSKRSSNKRGYSRSQTPNRAQRKTKKQPVFRKFGNGLDESGNLFYANGTRVNGKNTTKQQKWGNNGTN